MKKLFLASTLCLAGMGTISSAATFDFIAIADGGTDAFTDTNNILRDGGEAGWNTRVGAGVGILDTASGISVIATGSGKTTAGDNVMLEAYFDDDEAGLGVCGDTSGSSNSKGPGQCNPSNDDNIGALGGSGNSGDGSFEVLTLTFNKIVEMTEILFKAEGHGLYTGDLMVNGVETSVVGGTWLGSIIGSEFNFEYMTVDLESVQSNSTNEFYLGAVTVNEVPLPAGLPLLLLGLGGLSVMSRKTCKSS